MIGQEHISYLVAFVAGFLSYLSPCLLPLIPSYIAYMAGVSFQDLKDSDKKRDVRIKTLSHSLAFILGFSLVFVLLGLTATIVGKTLFQYQKAIRIIGGILIMIFGLNLAGILKFDFLGKEKRFNIPVKGASYLSSFLIGVTFAAAWTPCVGPILGSILVLAGTKTSIAQGAGLLIAYSAGIAVPFLLTALAINSFLGYFDRFKKILGVVNIIGGVLLIVVGFLVATNYIAVISGYFVGLFVK